MYPIIAVTFAIANILSVTISSTTSGIGSGLADLLSLFALVIPLFLIPFSFRLAGGVMGQIAGAVNDRKGRITAPLGKFRQQRMQKHRQMLAARSKSQDFFRGAQKGSLRGRINQGIAVASNVGNVGTSGFKRKDIKSDISAAIGYNRNKLRKDSAENSLAFQEFANNDTMLEAARNLYLTGEDSARARLAKDGIVGENQDRSISLIRRAQKDLGAQNLALSSVVANGGTGTGYAGNPAEAYKDLAAIAGDDMDLAIASYADLRGNFERANRPETQEGFGSAVKHISDIHASLGNADIDTVVQRASREMVKNALEVKGAGAFVGGRGQSAQLVSQAMQDKLKETTALVMATKDGRVVNTGDIDSNGNPISVGKDEAIRQYVQARAQTSTFIDYASGAAPEISRHFADTVFNEDVQVDQLPDELKDVILGKLSDDGTERILMGSNGTQIKTAVTPGMTIKNNVLMSRLESMDAFKQIKKVYGDPFQDSQAAQVQGRGPFQPPPQPNR